MFNIKLEEKSYKMSFKAYRLKYSSQGLFSSSHKNNMLKISHYKTFYFLIYALLQYVKSFFANIKIQ